MEENPFPDLKVADFAFLSALESRQKCGVCGKSRMFYCYTCFVALPSLADQIPRVKLPYKVHVIKHPGEVCGKSTAIHAAVLAPNDVTIFTCPNIPEYNDSVKVVLVYPGGNAITLKDYLRPLKEQCRGNTYVSGSRENNENRENTNGDRAQTNKVKQMDAFSISRDPANNSLNYDGINDQILEAKNIGPTVESVATCGKEELNRHDEEGSYCQAQSYGVNLDRESKAEDSGFSSQLVDQFTPIDVVVFIDCTWFQVHKISSDPRLSNLQRIELTSHETKFWRPQLDKPSTYLSTIEAIYYFAREYHDGLSDIAYDGRYDNLMFFFCFFYHKIKNLSAKTGKKLKAYHQERIKKPRQQLAS